MGSVSMNLKKETAQTTVYSLIIDMALDDEKREKALPVLPDAFQATFKKPEKIDYPIIFRLVNDSTLTEKNFDNVLHILNEINMRVTESYLNQMIEKIERHFQLSFEQKLNYEKIKDSFQRELNNAQRTLDETDKKINNINEKYKDAKKNLEKLQESSNAIYAQFVTILGIFTAIVLSVIGGLELITSAFENLHLLPAWKAVMMSSILALAVICMLFLLTRWISVVINRAFNRESERNLLQIATDNGAFTTGIFIFGYLVIASVIFSSKDVTSTLKGIFIGWNGFPVLLLLLIPICLGAMLLIKLVDIKK